MRMFLLVMISLLGAACAPTYAAPVAVATPPAAATGVATPGSTRAESTASRVAERGEAPARDVNAVHPVEAPPNDASLAPAQPTLAKQSPRPFVERSAVEALDRVAFFFPFETVEKRKRLTLASDMLFAPGSETIEAGAPLRLDSLAGALKAQGPHSIRVLAFTDSLGDRDENQALSERRASALRDYFVSRGVDPERIAAEGKGAARFVASNATPEGRAANRPVEVWIE